YLCKANAVCGLGNDRAAVALYDQCIAIRERLVNQEGRRELVSDLAWAVAGRASAHLALGDREKARTDARRARPILEAEVARTGRADLQRILDWMDSELKDVL